MHSDAFSSKRKALIYSYGSGFASSMYVIEMRQSFQHIIDKMDLLSRLKRRVEVLPEEYSRIMSEREKIYGVPSYQVVREKIKEPSDEGGSQSVLVPEHVYWEGGDHWYLSGINTHRQRKYVKNVLNGTPINENGLSRSSVATGAPAKGSIQSINPNEVSIKPNEVVELPASSFGPEESLNQSNPEKNQSSFSSGLIISKGKINFPHLSHVHQALASSAEKGHNPWANFYKKPLEERKEQLAQMYPDLSLSPYDSGGLSSKTADNMIENCIGRLSLPIGLGLNFLIDGQKYVIPMAIEEPSVIAAASSGAKFIAEVGNGFHTFSSEPIMIGQVQIMDPSENAESLLEENKGKLIEEANKACENMVKRGGGVRDMMVKRHELKGESGKSMVIVNLLIDVCNSMGANIVNTICESVAPHIEQTIGGRVVLRILSNLCIYRRASAEFRLPIEKMASKGFTGRQVAQAIHEAYLFASHDPFRAVTHNKGVMNGIDAVAIATGQDWRAIEAAAHAFTPVSSPSGKYQPLTSYFIEEDGKHFVGKIDIPIAVGTIGGVISSNPIYINSLRLLGSPDSRKLAQIIACVGLAQNFSALRALSIEGIQKGHMRLHARNIAISVGVPAELIHDAVHYMIARGQISTAAAMKYLEAIHLFDNINEESRKRVQLESKKLSIFFVSVQLNEQASPLELHLAFDSGSRWRGSLPDHIVLDSKNQAKSNIGLQIFGNKSVSWLRLVLALLEQIVTPLPSFVSIGVTKLLDQDQNISWIKLATVLLSVLATRLSHQDTSKKLPQLLGFLEQAPKIQSVSLYLRALMENEKQDFAVGVSLLSELIRATIYRIDEAVGFEEARQVFRKELFLGIKSIVESESIWRDEGTSNFEEFVMNRMKKVHFTLIFFSETIRYRFESLKDHLMVLSLLQEFGSIQEFFGVIIRDTMKAKDTNEPNALLYWLRLISASNKPSVGTIGSVDSREIQTLFLRNVMESIYKKLLQENKSMKEDSLRRITRQNIGLLAEYYGMDSSISKALEAAGITSKL